MNDTGTQLDRAEQISRDLAASAEFINRDLSDLAFVQRVLEEAENLDNPLLERVRFLAITGMLLDEFYRIRVAALREQIRARAKTPRGGLKPAKQLKAADKHSKRLTIRQDQCWRQLKRALHDAGVELLAPGDIDGGGKHWLQSFFAAQIRPRLRPITAEREPALAALKDGDLLLFAKIEQRAGASAALVPIPADIPRFVALPGPGRRFIPIEGIIKAFLGELFPGGTVVASGLARVLREGSLKRFEEGDDLLQLVREAIERREHADVIRLRVERDMPEHLTQALAELLGLLRHEDIKALEKSRRRATASEFVVADSFLGLPDLMQLVDGLPGPFARPLLYPSLQPSIPAFLAEFDGDLFRAIATRDRMLHFPYHDFELLVRFLEQAAADDAVISIKQTLYRTGRDSPIVHALASAAESGKSVSVVVELEAREDEADNIALAEFLEAAGVDVSYGLLELKVHAKLLIVERLEQGSTKSYVHCSTGNYERLSGHHYTDLCLFSVDDALSKEAQQLFAYVHDGAAPTSFERIAVAPLGLRERIAELIERETRNAAAGRPAAIWMKLNKLSDERMIRLLYHASRAGVRIEIIVRGICCLRPRVPGLSDNIRVKSVVGRHLEHSRILAFGNGEPLPSDSAAVFISSADLMAHKLDRRVEALVSIEDGDLKRWLQQGVFEPYLRDEANSWFLDCDDQWQRGATRGYSVQRALYRY